MGGVVSLSKNPEDIWYVAGWAFRQLLEDVSGQYADDAQILAELEKAELHAGLILHSLDAPIADCITQAISKVIDGILNRSIRSGIEDKPYGDSETVEQYFGALNELSRMILKGNKNKGRPEGQPC